MLQLEKINCTSNGKTRLRVNNLSTKAGQLTGIVGPNGAGKTTLFNVISGELRSNGRILLHDAPLNSWPALQKARHMAVLSQSSQIAFAFTAHEVVALGLTPLSLNKRDANLQIQTHMRMTDCLHFSGQNYLSLSGGERQRVQLARVLLQLSQAEKEPLLLLDEPTSAQDLGQQHSILELARSLCKERHFGILAILHDLNQVVRYCDHCALLSQGTVIQTGHPNEVLCEDSIERHWHYRPTRVALNGSATVFV
ncbi:MAG: heme ABC transporter ATP-binding protein [Pseudomonadales bacterium]